MKITGSTSMWKFPDLLKDQAKKMIGIDDPEIIEERLVKFLEKLPNGDYEKLISKWKKGEGY